MSALECKARITEAADRFLSGEIPELRGPLHYFAHKTIVAIWCECCGQLGVIERGEYQHFEPRNTPEELGREILRVSLEASSNAYKLGFKQAVEVALNTEHSVTDVLLGMLHNQKLWESVRARMLEQVKDAVF